MLEPRKRRLIVATVSWCSIILSDSSAVCSAFVAPASVRWPALISKQLAANKDGDAAKENKDGSQEANDGSKDKVISALSQPKDGTEPVQSKRKRNQRTKRNKKSSDASASSSILPPPVPGKKSRSSKSKKKKQSAPAASKSASLLPPPLTELPDDEDLAFGLSSWEEFLTTNNVTDTNVKQPNKRAKQSNELPSVKDLFPTNKNDTALPGMQGVLPVSELFYRSSQSMATSGSTTSASTDDDELPFSAEQTSQITSQNNRIQVRRNKAPQQQTRKKKRKMVRRGMDMFVGGVPIQADPPQRAMELFYNANFEDPSDWQKVITVNTPDFGPLLSNQGVAKVSELEEGLFCESFAASTMKWDVCPQDLRDICQKHMDSTKGDCVPSYTSLLESVQDLPDADDNDVAGSTQIFALDDFEEPDPVQDFLDEPDQIFECNFGIQLEKSKLESEALDNVILKTIVLVAKTKLFADDFTLALEDMTFGEEADASTRVLVKFRFDAEKGEEEDLMSIAESIQPLLIQATKDGTFAAAMVDILEEEEETLAWRDTMLQCLSNPSNNEPPKTANRQQQDDDAPLDHNSQKRKKGDLYLGGGNDGVFFDYSQSNKDNAPFKGSLGPLLRDAAIERVKQRQPRIIAIGDVHGCIDELQDLLRLCDYKPGDLVCFLGDLVCKGPDSTSVVQMAREIGAIGVRGNHDFEVIRWYQAIKSSVDPPVVGSEHFHLASSLSKADMKWLYSLPWYISSKDLGTLFVHAGFVAGIRLAKQNPRLMMNVRSILPDGTVTSKFFSNWPWARLWDGPQTVLFGHDADRGLQQYEHAIGLDTGCVYGGRLTACILPEKRLVSVSARREYFKYRRRHYD